MLSIPLIIELATRLSPADRARTAFTGHLDIAPAPGSNDVSDESGIGLVGDQVVGVEVLVQQAERASWATSSAKVPEVLE